MRFMNIVDEDYSNYKKCSMFIGTASCDGKCWIDLGLPKETCQNFKLYYASALTYAIDDLIQRYLLNPISSAIVFGGLEPLMPEDREDLLEFIDALRDSYDCEDDIVIYTGYYPDEVEDFIDKASKYKNVYVKFGRYIPNRESRFDEVLGVTLVSDNQFAMCISE